MKQTRIEILKVLSYFDLFDYPLAESEIRRFLYNDPDDIEMTNTLQAMIAGQYIFKINNFYSLRDDFSLFEKRIAGNNRARLLLAIAKKTSRFLFNFPFVRGIGISGSLSKNTADEKDDIDYFIITSANRLWIARTLMHLFKKLSFLTGKQHWYCMNYYVDEQALQIEEKNIFTAIEIVTLLPMCGNGTMDEFFNVNEWTGDYFPNSGLPAKSKAHPKRVLIGKKLLEFFLNNFFSNRLDNYLMKITATRWARKEAEHRLNISGNRMGIKTGKHYCKPNPQFL